VLLPLFLCASRLVIPAFVLFLWCCAPHPVLGSPTGLFPVDFEGRIHYRGEVIPRGTAHASFWGLLCGFRSILYGAVATAAAPRGGLREVRALELPPLVFVALPPLVLWVLSIILAGPPGAVER